MVHCYTEIVPDKNISVSDLIREWTARHPDENLTECKEINTNQDQEYMNNAGQLITTRKEHRK